jgi:hypothetical protein
MRNLFVVCLALSAAFASAGCKKKSGDAGNEAFGKMTEFKDQMCACKDTDCVNKVTADMAKWGEEQAKKMEGKPAPKMSDADTKKYADVSTKFQECAQKAMAPAAGATPPAADPAAAPAGSAAPAADPAAAPAPAAPAAGSAAP